MIYGKNMGISSTKLKFSLIFFSEHGTIVDNIVYSLDAAGHKSDMPKAKAAKFEANCLKMSADNKQVGEEGCFCDKSLGKVALEVSWSYK